MFEKTSIKKFSIYFFVVYILVK